ncbi:MAG: oleate hydratase [Christensenellaceae bacterium]
MKNYDRVSPRKPEGIEKRKAYIVGGGIAGLSAAAFLVRDAHMPGENITVYDQLSVFGGSMDGCGNAESGYISRGERELEPYMECLWDLFGSIPSIEEEGRTVLDETRECNAALEICPKHRLWEVGFTEHDESAPAMGVSKRDQQQMIKMALTPEEQLENVTIEEWFSKDFFRSTLWYYWASMLAFKPYHSLIEMKRYTVRFMHSLDGIEHLKGILRTKHDQYNSLIKPLIAYLADNGVRFVSNTTVTDMELNIEGNQKTVTALVLSSDGEQRTQTVNEEDVVYFTNGSMTQNSSSGSNDTPPVVNRDLENRGCFTLWEKLAKKSDVFGRPEKFLSTIDKSTFVSCSMTVKDYPDFLRHIVAKTGVPAGAAGGITFVDHPWFITISVALPPVFPDQPDNVDFVWFYGLYPENEGVLVKKKMADCTGDELLKEFCHCIGFDERFEDVRAHTKAIPVVMPYITSQFMPRGTKDRPEIIPEGCTNLALIGQFVELPGDVVFTVETSVRTAMTAVYRTMHLDKPITPLYQGHYDIRICVTCLKKLLGKDKIELSDLPEINPLHMKRELQKLLDAANSLPNATPTYYPEREENK